MAYDAELADRVREVTALRSGVSERKMFGGVGFMIGGNLACGVYEDGLIVRLGRDEAKRALTEPHTREFDLTGRVMRAWVFVDAEALVADEDLAGWVDAGVDFAASLPEKQPQG